MFVLIVSIFVQAFNPPQVAAYTCHKWLMHPDASITCETGDKFNHGSYRFERTPKGLVAIVEP